MSRSCRHLNQIKDVTPQTPNGCGECMESGDTWVSLRMCLTCGHIGCCDSSKNKHATKHFHETHHALMKPYKDDAKWKWCYIDEMVIE